MDDDGEAYEIKSNYSLRVIDSYNLMMGSLNNLSSIIYRHQLMTVERIHPKAPVMLIFIAIFTCLPSCINVSKIYHQI